MKKRFLQFYKIVNRILNITVEQKIFENWFMTVVSLTLSPLLCSLLPWLQVLKWYVHKHTQRIILSHDNDNANDDDFF